MQKKSDEINNSDLLMAALDHATRWSEFNTTTGFQVINFFLLTAAVLAAAYVSALNGHLDVIAGVIALIGGAASVGAYLVGRRHSYIARLAGEPLKQIQDRLARDLNIDSLRMVEQVRDSRHAPWRRSNLAANAIFPVVVAFSIAAAIYAWLRP
jgi:hypothetical protein